MYELLEKAPEDHSSGGFIDFLRDNNIVVFESSDWLIIENCKYHKFDRKWYTAFAKTSNLSFHELTERFGDMTWLKKPKQKQSVNRFHIHLYEEL